MKKDTIVIIKLKSIQILVTEKSYSRIGFVFEPLFWESGKVSKRILLSSGAISLIRSSQFICQNLEPLFAQCHERLNIKPKKESKNNKNIFIFGLIYKEISSIN